MKSRQALHAYIDPDTHVAWQAMAEENGVSVTGLLESLGRQLKAEIAENGGDADGVRKDWVKAGRKIDAERRKRGYDR